MLTCFSTGLTAVSSVAECSAAATAIHGSSITSGGPEAFSSYPQGCATVFLKPQASVGDPPKEKGVMMPARILSGYVSSGTPGSGSLWVYYNAGPSTNTAKDVVSALGLEPVTSSHCMTLPIHAFMVDSSASDVRSNA